MLISYADSFHFSTAFIIVVTFDRVRVGSAGMRVANYLNDSVKCVKINSMLQLKVSKFYCLNNLMSECVILLPVVRQIYLLTAVKALSSPQLRS